MKKTKIESFDLELCYEKLDNGLDVYIIPTKTKGEFKVSFLTKYGGRDLEFIPAGEDNMVKFPSGISHFLEHKMKEVEKGVGPVAFYARSGSIRNASNWYNKTAYYFKGYENFSENLIYLLDLVQKPYFTTENVEREKNIILEEMKRNGDAINRQLLNKTLENIFSKYNYKIPNIGTEEDVKKITKDDLYRCYNTFYHPSNMCLFITGNLDPEKVLKEIKENQDKKDYNKNHKIIKRMYDEPNEVFKKYSEFESRAKTPFARISYKINLKDLPGESTYIKFLCAKLIISANLSNISDFKGKLKENDIELSSLSMKYRIYEEFLVFSVTIETKKIKETVKIIDYMLEEHGLDKEVVDLAKRDLIGKVFLKYSNLSEAHKELMNDYLVFDDVMTNQIKTIESISYEELNKFYNSIDFSNKTVVVAKAKE